MLEEWGFAARVPYGQGVAALFSGPSGTGKTMAAQIIARDLGVDLLQVDLSKTVSKYIGETEKNLDRVFDAAERTGAVLLFDEADAVFGKRTEIKDAHDRHANVEVAYLLQRMESFRGLAILTTNLKENIDGAFLRRLRFVVDFAVPTAAERARIWHKAFPPAAPLAGARRRRRRQPPADHRAAASRTSPCTPRSSPRPDGGPIGLDHVRTATRRELRKTGMLAAEKTLDDWPVPEAAHARAGDAMTADAIALVTAALQARLESAVGVGKVYVGPPVAEDVADRKLALFLVHVVPEPGAAQRAGPRPAARRRRRPARRDRRPRRWTCGTCSRCSARPAPGRAASPTPTSSSPSGRRCGPCTSAPSSTARRCPARPCGSPPSRAPWRSSAASGACCRSRPTARRWCTWPARCSSRPRRRPATTGSPSAATAPGSCPTRPGR